MIYLDSDTCFHFSSGLRFALTGIYINNATVTGHLKSLDETLLHSFTFEYIPGSNGDYSGVLLAAESLAHCDEGEEYLIDVVIEHDSGKQTKRERHIAEYQGYE